jgi:hypothetical protein
MAEAEVMTIECPSCAEQIKPTAKKCRHCGEILDLLMRDIETLKKRETQNVFMNAGGAAASSSSSSSGHAGLRSFNHVLHIFLCVFTGGMWLPVYLLIYFLRNKSIYY